MKNTFLFGNMKGLLHFLENHWDENSPIRVEKRLTQYAVITQEKKEIERELRLLAQRIRKEISTPKTKEDMLDHVR